MLAISAGHYPAARGATNSSGFSEFPETLRWATKIMTAYSINYGNCYLIASGTLGYKMRQIKALAQENLVKLAIEIHFNSSAVGKGKGCETLYYPGSKKGLIAALEVQNAMSSILPPNRGVKEGWYKMDIPGQIDYKGDIPGDEKVDAFLTIPGVTCLIIEPEFIQNEHVIKNMTDVACEIIASACYSAIKHIS